MVKYTKEFARNYSLFQVIAYMEFMKRPSLEFSVVFETGRPLFVFEKEPMVDIYYPKGEMRQIFGQFGKAIADEEYSHGVMRKFLEVVEEIKPYFKKEKAVKNIEELKHLYELYLDFLYGESAVWVAPLVKGLPEKLRKKALSIREQTENLTSMRDELFDYNLGKLHPNLGELTHFALPDSVFNNKNEIDLKEEAKKYKKGFMYFDKKFYFGEKKNILKKLNIEIANIKSKDVRLIKGQIASNGATKGRVKIVLITKDIDKVEEGDILLSPMTRPDFLPAMKKASAFVTDEGGITCHAAIVSREMKKPCIIGTKIATQVLKDGDLVKVDANNGVVKILKRAG